MLHKTVLTLSGIGLGLALVAAPSVSLADGCAPGEACWNTPKKKQMIKPAPAAPVAPAPMEEPMVKEEAPAPVMMEEKGGLNFGIAAGVNVLFFKCEDTEVAPAVYVDVKHDDAPINVRLGVEGARIEAEQFRFTPGSQFQDGDSDFNFFRIPLSVEYVQPIAEKTEVLVGGGPDLIILRDAANDTTVGFHLGARVRQGLTDNLGLSVGGGYLFAEPEVKNEDFDADSAFVGADVSYRF